MSDGYIYTGITSNLSKRLSEHKNGLCRITKNRGKIEAAYVEKYFSRIDVARREKEIKGWSRKKKIKLIEESLHRGAE